MKKSSFIVASILVVIFLAVCCLFAGQLVLNRCLWWDCAPERNFHVLDWEVPSNLLPEGAINDHLSIPSEGIGEIESGGQTIYFENGIAVYVIYRFPQVKDAISHFEHYKRGMVDPGTGEAWDVPNELSFSTRSADDVYYACGYSLEYRCEMAAQYQEYTLYFGTTINDKMTYDVFENVIIYLDEQISNRLYP
jgi:hypothetical protein